ncbi:uncharacterized protein PFL1_06382 [Pseudozyma flocculosa PF-1]|uniref:F-box domain-containing protein n=2 Tax=Pseudozyma flocculosa TaxID=84751 RepID=A0A5C3F9K6_9BASI|nr:uncharacterized protein PFL1_06382 [Pseudozyma flocculosa PF-1]EPQ26175.1 hypothetical protein PFL1_06382 [Pseudozyma flocculosa PF-1]SPO40427.1 uncharacterized protein PSFLO_05909 [Pseudozyma flocculosa]
MTAAGTKRTTPPIDVHQPRPPAHRSDADDDVVGSQGGDSSSTTSHGSGSGTDDDDDDDEPSHGPTPSSSRRRIDGKAPRLSPSPSPAAQHRRTLRRDVRRLLAIGDHAQAAEVCTRHLAQLRRQQQPNTRAATDSAFLLVSRSMARERAGCLDDSLKDAKAAIRIDPDNPKPYLRAASALAAAGHVSNARSCLAAARSKLSLASSQAEHAWTSTSPSALVRGAKRRAHLEHRIARLEASISSRPLASLPLELILRILSFLDVKQLLRTLTVSRQWRAEVLAYPPLWRHLDLTQLVSLHQMRQELKSDGRRTRRALERFCHLSRNSLVSLRLSAVGSQDSVDTILALVRSNAATLEHLQLDRCTAHQVLASVVPACQSLRSLEIQHPPSSRYSVQEADANGGSMVRAGLSSKVAERLSTIRLETFGVHREALAMYPQLAPMLSQLRVLKVCSPSRMCSPFAHLELYDAFAFDALAQAHATIEEVRLSTCQQLPIRFEGAPPRNEPTSLVFERLRVLEGWLPRVVRGRREMRRETGLHFSFPALQEAEVGFECDEDEEAFYRHSPRIERLSHRCQLYPQGTREPTRRIAMLEDLRALSIAYRAQIGEDPAAIWPSLVPHRIRGEDDAAVVKVACPKLTELRIEYADRDLTGTLLIRLVLLRLYLSKGLTFDEAVARARPEKAPGRATTSFSRAGAASSSSSPFSRASGASAPAASARPDKLFSTAATKTTDDDDDDDGGGRVACCAIVSLHLRGCDGVSDEAAEFLRKVVADFSYSP